MGILQIMCTQILGLWNLGVAMSVTLTATCSSAQVITATLDMHILIIATVCFATVFPLSSTFAIY